jgi:hypothetical protein
VKCLFFSREITGYIGRIRVLRMTGVHVVSPNDVDLDAVPQGIARLKTRVLDQGMVAQLHKETGIAYVGGHES